MYINVFDGKSTNFVIDLFNSKTWFICIDSKFFVVIDVCMLKMEYIIEIGSVKIVIITIMVFLNLNFSFDAILVMYINRTSIPPTIIKNIM